MSSFGQLSPVSDQDGVVRPTAKFHSNIWGDRFLNYNFEQDKIRHASDLKELQDFKEQVRRELLAIANHSLSDQLNLIDAIERLGVGYHFETEIEQLLRHVYHTTYDHHHTYDLYTAALCFRLLRQHGHRVSSDIFNKFKDDKGNFKESLKTDVAGMLSLYEAAQLIVHGEDILEEAIAFSTTHLRFMATYSTDHLAAAQILHVLKWPIHRAVPRIETRRYISIYQDEPSHNQALLKLAKLDFNILQVLYKKELCEFSKWWKDLDFVGRLPFARDRLVECYFWMLGLYHQPDWHFSINRRALTRGAVLLTVIDDTYDAYGTPKELKLFTEAIDRWDMNCMDTLPEYMQIIYRRILDFYQEVEEELTRKGWSYRVRYGIEAMKMICRAYYEESTWFRDNRTPTYEEYMRVALVSVGSTFTILQAFMSSMDSRVTKEALDWALSRPPILNASEVILRLIEDVKSHKFERERGHIPSSVECYMKQYGASQKETYEEFNKQVNNAWKDVNEECLKLSHRLPRTLLMCILNFTRTTHLIYDGDDNFTRVGKQMQAHIASLLEDPVPM